MTLLILDFMKRFKKVFNQKNKKRYKIIDPNLDINLNQDQVIQTIKKLIWMILLQ